MSRNPKSRTSFVWMTMIIAVVIALSTSVGWTQAAGTTEAAADAGPTDAKQPRPGHFDELHIRKLEIRSALEMLNSQVKKNIITTKEATGTVTADLYDVSFDEALKAITEANGLAFVKEGNLIIVMTAEQKVTRTKIEQKQVTKVFRLSYTNAADMRVLITPFMSEIGTVAITPAALGGIATSQTDAGGNNLATSDVLIIRDYEDNIRRISEEITDLDSRPDQVLIEAVLLRARLGEDNALGVDFNALSGIDFRGLGATTNGLQSATVAAATPAIADQRAMTFRTDFNAAVPTGGLTFGFMSDNVGVFVRALEGITDVNVMANPKLLVVNKMRGEVMVGNKDGYLTTTFTETTASQTVEFLETGTRLVVRPFIGRDDHIRLEIHPEDSSGTVALVGTSALPSQTTTEVTSNVIVRDGHTIVIGGLFREDATATRSQTPIVGNLPYVGALWRNTLDAVNREEVIILVTPRIIRQGADEAISEQLRDDVERFRLGMRKGIRWWGRGRLANAQVRCARAAMAKGDRKKALWHVDAALSLLPTLVEAVELKERLTNRAYWADAVQESKVRFIIQNMIMNDLGKPVTRVIPSRKPLNGEGLDDDVKKALNIQAPVQDPLELADPPVVEDAPDADPDPATSAADGDKTDDVAGMVSDETVEPVEGSSGADVADAADEGK